jgi:secreted trypsin-like serine protease
MCKKYFVPSYSLLSILFCIIHATISYAKRNKDPVSVSRDLETARIIGGFPANPKRYPYFASLQIEIYQSGTTWLSSCGGSLIAPDVIMTAAHCLISAVRSYIFMDVNGEGQTLLRSSNFSVSHPSYEPNNLCSQNDIALVFMDSPVNDVPVVRWNRKSSLPGQSSRKKVTAIGFGVTDETLGVTSNELMEVSIRTLPNNVCEKQVGSCSVKKSDICTYDDKKGVCFGDSGGPLMLQTNSATKEMVQIGIVSRSKTVDPICIQSDTPQIFTRVSSYAGWVDKMTCKYSKHKPTICPTLKPSTKRPSKRPTKKAKPSA